MLDVGMRVPGLLRRCLEEYQDHLVRRTPLNMGALRLLLRLRLASWVNNCLKDKVGI